MPVTKLSRIGWVATLAACTALYAMLHLTVNSVKSEVLLAERKIVSLERETFRLETEFLTRANQRQLSEWNEVEFGYQSPQAGQFLENERALASLGMTRTANSPEPIRVASIPRVNDQQSGFLAMVSPLTGEAIAAEVDHDAVIPAEARHTMAEQFRAVTAADFGRRLKGENLRVALSGSAE